MDIIKFIKEIPTDLSHLCFVHWTGAFGLLFDGAGMIVGITSASPFLIFVSSVAAFVHIVCIAQPQASRLRYGGDV